MPRQDTDGLVMGSNGDSDVTIDTPEVASILLRAHGEKIRLNLRQAILIVVIGLVVLSFFVTTTGIILGALVATTSIVGGLGIAEVIHRRPIEAQQHLYPWLGLFGGIGWGLFYLAVSPTDPNAQMMLASAIPLIMAANLVAAGGLLKSFLAFHLSFALLTFVVYATRSEGVAQATLPIIFISSAYFWSIASNAWQLATSNAILTVRSEQLVAKLHAANDELLKLSTHDSLTGLPNRLALDQYIAELQAAVDTSPTDLAVFFIDLDSFKEINDQCGHLVGDEALRVTAQALRSVVEPLGVIARIAGDEMVAVLPQHSDELDIGSIADALVMSVRSSETSHALTVSVGAAIGTTNEDFAEVLRRSDSALYLAKAQGGDRHVTYTADLASN